MKTPDYIKLDGGFATVILTRGGSIRMREPTVADQLAIDKVKDGDAAKELSLFANLCELTPADLQKLTLKDYRRLQQAFAVFLD